MCLSNFNLHHYTTAHHYSWHMPYDFSVTDVMHLAVGGGPLFYHQRSRSATIPFFIIFFFDLACMYVLHGVKHDRVKLTHC